MSLLPELKAKGKTVIVISHDDRYYQIADRIIKLDVCWPGGERLKASGRAAAFESGQRPRKRLIKPPILDALEHSDRSAFCKFP